MAWVVGHKDSLWIGPDVTDTPKRKRDPGNTPPTKVPRTILTDPRDVLNFRLVPVDEEKVYRKVVYADELTLKELADQLFLPVTWISVRFALVMRERCERFRRVFFTEWFKAKQEYDRLERETPSEAIQDPEQDINRDSKAAQKIVMKGSFESIAEANKTLMLLKPSQEDMENLKTGLVKWKWDNLRRDLRKSLQQLNAFIGLEEVKIQVARLITSVFIEEKIKMPGDKAGNVSSRATPRQKLLALAERLQSIQTTSLIDEENVAKMVPEDQREERLDDRRKLFHMNFLLLGNPGTGKTTLAKTLSLILAVSGILPRRTNFQMLENTRGDIVGRVSGQTAIKTKSILLRALGSTVFVDELYALVADEDDSFGIEALNTIVPLLTQYRGMLSFIGAGYEDLIEGRIYTANQGFESRFPNKYRLPDYTDTQLNSIALMSIGETEEPKEKLGETEEPEKKAEETETPSEEKTSKPYDFSAVARKALQQVITVAWTHHMFENSNARGVEELLRKIIDAQSARIIKISFQDNKLRSPKNDIILEDVARGFRVWVEQQGMYYVEFEDESTSETTSQEKDEDVEDKRPIEARFH